MWKNWNLFKRRTEDNPNISVNPDVTTDGKENTSDMRARDVGGNVAVNNNQFGGDNSNRDMSLNNCDFSQVNGYNNISEGNSCAQASFEQESLRSLSGGRTSNDVHVINGYGGGGGYTPRRRIGTSLRRPVVSPFTQSDSSNLPGRNENMNTSFSGVYGPLLSSPLVPKVRRALETSTGLRSPQASLLTRGKPIGRSSSLNYGSGNPVKSTAGKVPWVRLKRKESLTLTDIVNGTTPQSPNTVKLAAPEPRFLPAAPSFKTTPLIVTTEHSRARVVDTQAVVSALREKRKRFGGGQREDSFSEDSWVNAAKRRRQDSSQSNASSVSIPSMPESLPDLMGTPGVSLLHIENLKDQRPSTVPAMDAFVSRHQREFGLGGDLLGQSPHPQVYNQQEVQGVINTPSSKSVLRSIQSSLSSSLRARTNLSTLQHSGVDLPRIRQVPESRGAPRRMSVSFDEPAMDQSITDTQSKVSRPTAIITTPVKTTSTLADKSTPGGSAVQNVTPLATQRQKIAEGVVLKKQNLSISSTSTPVRSKQMPLNMLISTNDIEQDRQKEYKRRVLDLLNEDESVERPDVSSARSLPIIVVPMTTSAPAAAISLGLPVSAAASSAATAAAVSASLDSLNKLVQSATAASGLLLTTPGSAAATLTSTSSLIQVLQSSSDNTTSSEQTQTNAGSTVTSLTFAGNSLATSSAPSAALNKEVSFGFNAATQPPLTASTQVSSATPTAAASSASGFQFGSSSAPSVEFTQITPVTATSGFQINFSATPVSLGTANTAAASVVSTAAAISAGSGQQANNSGFNLGFGSTSGSQPNTSMFGSALGGQHSANSGFNFSSLPASQTISSIGGTTAGTPAFSGVTQTTAMSLASGGNQLNSTLQNPDFSSKVPSAPAVTSNTQIPQAASAIFGSGIAQLASSSAPFSLSSTLQAFAASQPKDESHFQKPVTSGMLGQGFALNAMPLSSAAPSTSTPGLFSFGAPSTTPSTSTPGLFSYGAPSTTASLTPGFGFSNSGVGTSQPGTATVMGSSSAPSTAGTTSANFGFNFGATSLATTSAPQQPGGPSFGAVPASSLPAAGLTSGGFTTGQPNFSGYGLNNQINSTPSAFTSGGPQPQSAFTPTSSSVPASQPFGSGGISAFGSGSQSSLNAQQSFGASTAAPGVSMFGTSAATTTASTGIFNFGQTSAPPTTTTTNTGTFAFGQSSTSSAFSKPFAFGAASTQSGTGFGGITTTSNSVFGNIVSPTPSGATSVFGSGTTSAFGTNSVASPFGTNSVTSPFGPSVQVTSASVFGSSVPATSAQAFGSMVPTTAPPAFGSMVPTTAPPAFGSMVPTTAPPAFGSMVPTTAPPAFGSSMFGAMNSQTSSAFGTAPPSGGQPASVFGAPASASNQLFAFGAGSSSQSAPQQTPTFGSNPSGAFGGITAAGSNPSGSFGGITAAGSNPSGAFGGIAATGSNPSGAFGGNSATGSSIFGAKPAAPAFSAATANPAQVFGASVQSPSSATSPAFGSSFGMSTAFGAQPNTDKSLFGAVSSGFGNSAVSSFGATPHGSVFGASSQNAASNLFGVPPQNPPPAFGSQQGSVQTVASSPFGVGSRGASSFGTAKPNPFGAAATTQANFNFAATQPNPYNTQPANTGYNFTQQNTQPAASNGGFNFGAQTPTRPTLPAPSPGGFNFAATAAGPAPPAFNFSAAPSTPNPFTPQAPGAAPRPRAAARRATRRGGTRR